MKILVLSLLRAGDLLMHQPLIEGLKKKHQGAQIHVALNDEVAWASELLTGVTKTHIFPRRSLQRWIGEADHHLMKAPEELNRFIERLNSESFDVIYNFTHTRLSAYLAEEITAKEKQGLHTVGPRFLGLDNDWIRLFNDRFSANTKLPIHYTEILAKSFNIELEGPRVAIPKSRRRVFIQAFTSDNKKNWGDLNFRRLLDRLYQLAPSCEYKVLCSESEKTKLLLNFEDEELCTWSLTQLKNELSDSDILVTGDTVVMHLAAARGCQIVELSLGPSDPWKTGPWGAGHVSMSARVPCYPCVHSRPCRQLSHLCGATIPVELVAQVVLQCLKGQAPDVFHPFVNVSISEMTTIGLVADRFDAPMVLSKLLWEATLGKKSTIVDSANVLASTPRDLKRAYDEVQSVLWRLQSEFENLIFRLGSNELDIDDIQRVRRQLSTIPLNTELAKEWVWSLQDLAQLSFKTPLHFLSAFQDRLEQLKALIFFVGEFLENTNLGETDEPRTREVSRGRFTEA